MNWEKRVINGKEVYISEVTESDKSLAANNSSSKPKGADRLNRTKSVTEIFGGPI